MGELKAYDPYDNQKDRDQADDMVGVAEKDDPADDGAGGADSGPYRIGCPYGDILHGLGDGKEAEDDKNDGDDTGDELGKALAILQRNGEANLKKPCE